MKEFFETAANKVKNGKAGYVVAAAVGGIVTETGRIGLKKAKPLAGKVVAKFKKEKPEEAEAVEE